MLSIYDAGVRERAAAASLSRLDADTRKSIKGTVGPLIVAGMRRESARRARTPLARAVAATARPSWWKDIPGVAFGGVRPVTADGARGRDVARGTEYGSRGERFQRVATTSPNGRRYVARRRQTAAFRPRSDAGKFVTPAAFAVAPGVVDEWARLVVDATVDALDGRP